MSSSTRFRGPPGTSAPGDGSRTITLRDSQPREQSLSPERGGESGGGEVVGTLRLRGGPRKNRQRKVVWDEDVVDNEGCGRKSSKICCIYHKPKRFDESSDEEGSSDDSSDADSDYEGAGRGRCRHPGHQHDDTGGGSGGRLNGGGGEGVHTIQENDEPNAYEVVPPQSGKGKKKAT